MEIKVVEYANATLMKLKNRRVNIMSADNKEIIIELKILSEKETANTPRALHKTLKDKIVITGIKVSEEAATSIMYGIQQELKKRGVI